MVWALRMAGIEHLIHYLDHFLFLVATQTNEGTRIHSLALNVFARLGVSVALHKTEGSACSLGICIDTIAGELRLPLDKLQHLQGLIEAWAKKKASTKKELESFLGHLCNVATVVRPGRTFLRELLRLLHGVRHLTPLSGCKNRYYVVEVSSASLARTFLLPLLGYCSSGTWGCGAIAVSVSWFQLQWPHEWQEVKIFGKRYTNAHIMIFRYKRCCSETIHYKK